MEGSEGEEEWETGVFKMCLLKREVRLCAISPSSLGSSVSPAATWYMVNDRWPLSFACA